MKIRSINTCLALLCTLLLLAGCQKRISDPDNTSEPSYSTEESSVAQTEYSDEGIGENTTDDDSLEKVSEKIISIDELEQVKINTPLQPLSDTLSVKDKMVMCDEKIYFATQIQDSTSTVKSCELIQVDIQSLEEISRIIVETDYMPTFGNGSIFVLQDDKIVEYGYDLEVIGERLLPKPLSAFANSEGIKKHPAVTRDGKKVIVINQDWKPIIIDMVTNNEHVIDFLTLQGGFSPDYYDAIIEADVPNCYVLVAESEEEHSPETFIYSDSTKQIISHSINEFEYNRWLDSSTGIVYSAPNTPKASDWASSVSNNSLWANHENGTLADFSKECIYVLVGEEDNTNLTGNYATDGLTIACALADYDSGQYYFMRFPVAE